MARVPCIRLTHLSPDQKIAFAIADNKLGDLSTFDPGALKAQFTLLTPEFNLEITGFDTAEIDVLFDPPTTGQDRVDSADSFELPTATAPATSRVGDLWRLGKHRLICADALEANSYERLLEGGLADMVFTDCPYNVPIAGHVSGLGRKTHREFTMASGEMSNEVFAAFLLRYMRLLVQFSTDGSIHQHCMGWRGLRLLLEAGEQAYDELKNICTWGKTNAGMGESLSLPNRVRSCVQAWEGVPREQHTAGPLWSHTFEPVDLRRGEQLRAHTRDRSGCPPHGQAARPSGGSHPGLLQA